MFKILVPVAILAVVFANMAWVPTAAAGGPYYGPTYNYPTYQPYSPTYTSPGYYYAPPASYQYSYSYATPVYPYTYYRGLASPTYSAPVYSSPAYSAPVYRGLATPIYGGWGSFGTYDNWSRQFFAEHGRYPDSRDVSDYWWSQSFASRYGFSPYTGR